jgi:hypothetical protein
MQRLANHQTPMQHKHKHNGMERKRRAVHPQAKRNLLERPALIHPVRHDLHVDQRHGDGCAFEVLGFAGRVFGNHGDGDVEARETGEAAEDEEGEQDVVDGGAEAEGEGCGGGADTEGDLGYC